MVGVGCAVLLKLRDFWFGARPTHSETEHQDDITGADLLKSLKSIERALVDGEEGSLISQLKLSRQDTNDRLDALKAAQVEALGKLSEMGSKALVEALRDVIRDFNQRITEQFGENFAQLNAAVGRLLDWQEQYKGLVEITVQKLDETTLLMTKATGDYANLVDRSGAFTKVAQDLGSLISTLEAEKQQLRDVSEGLAKLLLAAQGSLPQVEQKVLELTGQLTRSVAENQRAIGAALTENTVAMRSSIQSAHQDMAAASLEQQKQLLELVSKAKQNVLELTSQLANAVTENQRAIGAAVTENATTIRSTLQSAQQDMSAANAEQNKQLAELVSKTKEQVAVLDRALSEELEKSLNSLGRQLTALSERFVSDYTPLTDKLRTLVRAAA